MTKHKRRGMNSNFVVYRLFNKKTKRIYIGSSSNYSKRKKYHLDGIHNKNHGNSLIKFDSIWCNLDDWDIKILKTFTSREEMLKFEEVLIRIYFGRSNSYNLALSTAERKTLDYIAIMKGRWGYKIYGGIHALTRGEKIKKKDVKIFSNGVYVFNGQIAINPYLLNLEQNSIKNSLDKKQTKQLENLIKWTKGEGITYNRTFNSNDYIIDDGEYRALKMLSDTPTPIKKIKDGLLIASKYGIAPSTTVKSLINKNLATTSRKGLLISEKGIRIIKHRLLAAQQKANI